MNEIRVTYFARHESANLAERNKGMKLGRIIKSGYRTTFEGRRIEILVDDGLYIDISKEERDRRLTELFEQQLGKKGIQLVVS